LHAAWTKGGWRKHLEWLEIHGFGDWNGERKDFKFPFVALKVKMVSDRFPFCSKGIPF
jgi:hypothetical protein